MKNIFLTILFSISLLGDETIVAFAQDNMGNDFRRNQVLEAKAESEKNGIKFLYSDAKGKTALLFYQIDKFIEQKVDFLIVGTNDAYAVVPVIEKAQKEGIEVIIVDRGVKTEKYRTFLKSDNVEIGKIGARYIVENLKEGTVLLLEGLPTADVTHDRTRGFLVEMFKYPNFKVIRRFGNYLRRDSIVVMEELLRSGVEVDAIYSESDSMLSGVRSAYSRFGKDVSDVITVGTDYTSEARENIRKGTQTASIKFPLAGKESIEVILKILKGDEVSKEIIIPTKLVTKENVENIEPVF
jgi:ribose transport system substrate-binding protein